MRDSDEGADRRVWSWYVRVSPDGQRMNYTIEHSRAPPVACLGEHREDSGR